MTARRTLAVLAGAALVSAAAAGFALFHQARQTASPSAMGQFLPGFAARVKDAARIHIVSHDGGFDVVYSADKGWVLPDRGNYPADFDQVRHTLIGLATLDTIAAKTAKPDWLGAIGLGMPPQGNGTLITVSDAKGHALASLVTGNAQALGTADGSDGLYVRRPDSNQSWLVRAVFVPHGDVAAWLLSRVIELEPARLQQVTVTPPAGPGFSFTRAHPSDVSYVLTPAPKNGGNRNAIDAVPGVLTSFAIADVKQAAAIDFHGATKVAAKTFDGLVITLDAVRVGGDVWVRIGATTSPGSPAIAEASALASRTAGWAYKLPPDKGQTLMTSLQSLSLPPQISAMRQDGG